ncbi:S41 family peptidase [Bergeyella sp. RCAD1439]|uniref:S41 family peptidase n=1 Tax=Bergeyella anatis TaxID=3113737 RepID=UPI002E171DA4|nr:S41 family peptidase [Bergeyella sp. RCAD1439]
MKKLYVSFFLISWSLCSANPPLWLRNPSISPDGKQVAFTYMGDIYTVPTQGGTATRLTTHPAYDSDPVWSPDGRYIAFSSDRENGFQRLFLMPSQGGEAKQITFHSQSSTPLAFSKDGKHIVYAANLQNAPQNIAFPSALPQLYQIPVEGGIPQRIFNAPTKAIALTSDGKEMYYENIKGNENQWRKHHTSSVTRDIWKYDFKKKKHEKIIDWKGEDRNPVLSTDGKTLYFLSERAGSFNVFKASTQSPSKAEQLTFHKEFPVRFLSVANNGTIVYGYDGELYLLEQGLPSKKIDVRIISDAVAGRNKTMNFQSGATSTAVSPDGKQIAMVIRGEVFVNSTDYTTTKQITKTAAAEQGVSFSADGRNLVYASYRDGYWDLYRASIPRKEDPNFSNATLISEEKLIPGDASEKMHPKFSPDGKEIAFVQNRSTISIYDLETKKVRTITDAKYQTERSGYIGYEWSPDGKWLVVQYTARNREPYSDIGIISTEGGKPIVNLTDSGYFDTNPSWALDGNAITWKSERYGMRNHASWGSMSDQMIVFLNREAYDKYLMSKEEYELLNQTPKKENTEEEKTEKNTTEAQKSNPKKEKKPSEIKIEWDNLENRIVRLTPNSSNLGDAIISKDGKKLYYLSAFEKGYDLWVHDLRERSTKLLSKLGGASASLVSDKEGKKIFLLGGSKMKLMELPSEKIKDLNFSASMKLDEAKEREFMFDMVKKETKERFYVKDMHGVDWEKLTEQYRKYLPHINNNYDFSEMLSELLGELNVSHTGSGYRSPSESSASTAQLGVFFTPVEEGLLIEEIPARSPFNHYRSKAKKGHIIEKIDGEKLSSKNDFYPYLEGKAGKKLLISIYDPQSGQRWDEEIKGMTLSQWNEALYQRWIQQRAADVEKWSEGRLGYVHIRSMGDGSFREAYSDVLGKYNDKEGIVIDIRNNGGGRLHEDIEVFFSAKKYLTQKVQGKKYGVMPSRRWTKPSIMVINEADYSNAHGTPWVYQHLGLGRLVGAPVPGTMTSVNWVTLQDPSLYFGIPVVGYEKADSTYLENYELQPDVEVYLDPEKADQGEDNQLKRAVEELLKDL